ncbi:calponin homology domain-containing protein DDB_G0272472-like [Ananas comosus]|uniref:Calponin homology domain-containing protein DDB_G0272472-like n=1 Tax=Ananas comosus TaxID=4615 RepID=A0A6P5EQD6_ANACO|nr:calponin homology domain-containing protein DDB_G0272472-like [Ananas comosus]
MEGSGPSRFDISNGVSKKRRTINSRRPRPASVFGAEADISPPSSTPSSDNTSKISGYDSSSRRKEVNLSRIESSSIPRSFKKEDKKFGALESFYRTDASRVNSDKAGSKSELKRCKTKEKIGVGSGPDAGYVRKSGKGEDLGRNVGVVNGSAENNLTRVTLRVGGVTRTINTKSNLESKRRGVLLEKFPRSKEASWQRQKLLLQAMSDDDDPPLEKGDEMQGLSRTNLNEKRLSRGAKEDSQAKIMEDIRYKKEKDKNQRTSVDEPARKSKRVRKRRIREGSLDEDDEDDEMRYIQKQKTSKRSKISAYSVDEDYGLIQSNKESRKKLNTGKGLDRTDYVQEEEPGSDDGLDTKKKKLKKESVEQLADVRTEPLTTRQRALQSSNGGGLIEFPDGLPPAPTRKQKEKLSEVEQQARKAEAAQRRRMQVEKAARELEAEAIRKILGQDSSRKKKEEKIRKEREELAQKKAAESLILQPNSVRWVMGPAGKVVTFGENVGLPCIFNSKQCSYPPPREKCAAPLCTNAYKYRDSQSKLPLCSLECYRAMKANAQPVSTC